MPDYIGKSYQVTATVTFRHVASQQRARLSQSKTTARHAGKKSGSRRNTLALGRGRFSRLVDRDIAFDVAFRIVQVAGNERVTARSKECGDRCSNDYQRKLAHARQGRAEKLISRLTDV